MRKFFVVALALACFAAPFFMLERPERIQARAQSTSGQVQGTMANGTTPNVAPKPVVTGGTDSGGVVRTARLDANGRAENVIYGLENGGTARAAFVIQESATATATPSLLMIGGRDGGNVARAFPVTNSGSAVSNPVLIVGGADGGGNARRLPITAGGTATNSDVLQVGGSDGTNARGLVVIPTVASAPANPNTLMVGGLDSNGQSRCMPLPVGGVALGPTNVNMSIGGTDGVNSRMILLDASGRGITVGAAANAAAVTGNPVLIAGSDQTNARSLPVAVRAAANAGTPNVVSVGGTDSAGNVADLRMGNDTTAHLAGDVFRLRTVTVGEYLGTQANAWSATAVGAGGTSTAIDTVGMGRVSIFGNVSGATTITVQFSQDNTNFYDSGTTTAPAANFGITFDCAARYVRLKSSAAVTITATIAGKS